MKMQKMAVGVIFGFVLGINVASAQDSYVFDELGNGTNKYGNVIPSFVGADPTGRSVDPVLIYTLPFASPAPGDIAIHDIPGRTIDPIEDVVTFWNPPAGGGEIIFYSLGPDYHPIEMGLKRTFGPALADITTVSFNNVLQNLSGNVQYLNEYGTEANNWFTYIDANSGDIYKFYSDVPEPSTFGLVALGAFGLLWRKRS